MLFGRKLKATPTPEELVGVERSLDARRCQLLGLLAAAEAELAEDALEAVLDDQKGTGTAASRRVAQLQADLRGCQAAISGIRSRRVAALEQQLQDESDRLRRRADELHNEAGKIEAQCLEPLRRLSVLQGVEFESKILLRQPNRDGFGYEIPKTERLKAEAIQIADQAEEITHRTIKLDGKISVEGAEQLEAALFEDARRICPTAESVAEWILECERVLERYFHHQPHIPKSIPSRHYRLVWRDSEIDREASTVTFGSPRPAIGPGDWAISFGPVSFSVLGRVSG